jgi:ADP-heptose:LPS heptosyltransferase
LGANEPFVVLHPGCHWGCNEWTVDRWATLGQRLVNGQGVGVVITGDDDEVPLARAIAERLNGRAIVAAGETSLRQFAALLSLAGLVVAVDTAPTQICQALSIPAVVLMGAGNPAWNGPLPGEPMIMLQRWDPADEATMRCDFAAGACHGPHCRSRLLGITVADVLQAARQILEQSQAPVIVPVLAEVSADLPGG